MIIQKFIFSCDFCKATEEQEQPIALDSHLLNPGLPELWTRIGPMIICNRHLIEMDIEGKKFFVWQEKVVKQE